MAALHCSDVTPSVITDDATLSEKIQKLREFVTSSFHFAMWDRTSFTTVGYGYLVWDRSRVCWAVPMDRGIPNGDQGL